MKEALIQCIREGKDHKHNTMKNQKKKIIMNKKIKSIAAQTKPKTWHPNHTLTIFNISILDIDMFSQSELESSKYIYYKPQFTNQR